MKKQIDVIGIGPGHPDWLLPIAKSALTAADVVIGGRRQLAELAPFVKETRLLEGNYAEMADWILRNAAAVRIAVAVSGDTGFYSLLGYLKKHLPGVTLNVIPGIGSLQYFFGRLGLSWEHALLLSAHGRELNFSQFGPDTVAGILTDAVMTPGAIASALVLQNQEGLWMAVGEKLSYADETITIGPVTEIQGQLFEPLNAVLILPAALGIRLKEDMNHEE